MAKKMSLRTRITLCLLGCFCLVLVTAYVSSRMFTGWYLKNVEGQQMLLLTRIAEELDDKIRTTHDLLILEARQFTPAIVADPRAAEHKLHDHVVIDSIFDSGLFLFSPAGKIIAETAHKPSRTGLDLSDREYIKVTRSTGKPYISDPFTSFSKQRPVIMFTAPVVGPDGSLIAILGGRLDLHKANFLGKLARARIGRSGFFFLFTRSRAMIMHPDPDMIMKNNLPPGLNRLFDLAVAGQVASGETSTAQGARSVQSFKPLRSVNWVLAADQPAEEVYEPIRKAAQIGLLAIFFGGVIISFVMWCVMSNLTAPILSLNEQMRCLERGENARHVTINSRDEVEELADTFNRLMDLVRKKEQELYNLSIQDNLTRLYNRGYLEAELKRLSKGRNFPVSVIVADLDGLKTVNDTLGHAAGDRLLKSAALILRKAFRREDVVARIGGDEFSILLAGTDQEEAEDAMQRVKKLADAHNRKLRKVHISFSLGAATAHKGESLDDALALADKLMYADKWVKKGGQA
jgi:diguanylate cyclase (GGDEF)-like protein